MSSSQPREMIPIAVVGVSALFPGSSDARGFWADILAGRDLITDVPATHWLIDDYFDPDPSAQDKTYCKRGAFLSPVDFDPMEFGMPPNILPTTDAAQILALIAAGKVLADASHGNIESLNRERISVVLGVTSGQQLLNSMVSRLQRPIWIKALRESGIEESEAQAICDRIAASYVPWHESAFPGLLGNVVAGRIANRFDLRGTNAVTDAACASSMAAVSMAVNELQLGQSDLVITGGVDTMNDIFMYVCFSKTPALSPSGDCRPFSDRADGTLLGEGISMLALKRLDDAERDGDRIYAVIRGVGSSSDGRSKSVYAPLPEGQARALRRAYASAGYGPETVELVEAHGTGTKAGDAAEFEALRATFSESSGSGAPWCALGSIKSQIGHTKAAAGAAGLFKAIMALHHKVLPPTIKIDRPNPSMGIEESPFYLNTRARPWIRDHSHPRRASVSSFGFGGSNFHVTLEEYVPCSDTGRTAWRLRTTPTELVLLSAPNGPQLLAQCRSLDAHSDLALIARKSQEQFRADDPFRLAVVAANANDLADKLAQATALIGKNPDAPFVTPNGASYSAGASNPGSIAFLFPGQGSQYLGMGADAAMTFDAARSAWDRTASLRFGDQNTDRVVFPAPAFTDETREAQTRKLTATEWAQPAIAVQSIALLEILRWLGIRAEAVAGHSFGEITALHAAGAFDEATLVKIARKRGELMRDAWRLNGAMTALSCSMDEANRLIEGIEDVVVANHNAPLQCVLSGTAEAIARAESVFASKGISTRRLDVATAFHSPLVAASTKPFHSYLTECNIAAPNLDVYAGADGQVYPRDAQAVHERLSQQIAQPVRFLDQIEAMYARGCRTFIEVGPGSVLTELVGRILGTREHRAIALDRKSGNGVTNLQIALGRLAVSGIALNFDALWSNDQPALQEPAKKPAMAIPVSGVNYGKPYPPAGGSSALPPPNPPRPATSEKQHDRPKTNELPMSGTAPNETIPDMPIQDRQTHAGTKLRPEIAEPQSAWLQVYEEALRQTAEAHSAYQRAMADSHIAFLNTTQASFAGMSALLNGNGSASAAAIASVAPAETSIAPISNPVAVPPPGKNEPFATPKVIPVARESIDSLPGPIHASTVRPSHANGPSPANTDLESLLMEIVSEKTGYPVQMLGAHMDLEADLGIDSIKRVEILSALGERVPGVEEVKMVDFAQLRTLGQIVAQTRTSRNGLEHAKASANGSSTNGSGPHRIEAINGRPFPDAPAGSEIDLERLLIDIVSEKTGYPANMLAAHMDLEGDLGIDSIKRVEILSAMAERAPGVREVKMTEFATLRTLGQIVEHVRSGAHGFQNGIPSLNGNREASPDRNAHPVAAEPTNIERFVLHAVDAPAVGLALGGIYSADRVLITDDDTGLAALLAEKMAERKVRADVVAEVPEDAEAVIFLGGMRRAETIDDALAVNREAFRAAQSIAPRFASAAGGVFVTVQDTGGDFGLRGSAGIRSWLGGVPALARTAALEWPHAAVKTIDCERGGRSLTEIAEAICHEIFEGGSAPEVGLRANGQRVRIETLAVPAQTSTSTRVGPQSVVVATGCARGVSAASLLALARAHRPRIFLLGRTALIAESETTATPVAASSPENVPTDIAEVRAAKEAQQAEQKIREIRETLQSLREAGSQPEYLAVDITSSVAVIAALRSIRQTAGEITALIHGAGVLADKRIADKTDDQFDGVFNTKVEGLRALLDATANDPLTAIALFSSQAARTGNPGQCDYAMANEILNLVARAESARRGDACSVRSIGWGPWDGGMVTPSLKAYFKQMGVNLIPLDAGARMFVEEIDSANRDAAPLIVASSEAGGLGTSASQSARLEVRVGARSHPYLDDHRIKGMPVLPIVIAVEWMLRSAGSCCPGLTPIAVRNMRVLSGIKLDQFDRDGNIFKLHCLWSTTSGKKEIALEIRSQTGILHYSAIVEMATRFPPTSAAQRLPILQPWDQGETYDGEVLFHGPQFQVVRSLDGISNSGIAGELAGVEEMGWPRGGWFTDPALLDGGLQLAGLWTRQVLGGISLPMAFGEFRLYRGGPIDGRVRAVVHARQVLDARSVCDVRFMSPDGSVLAQIDNLESVLRPEAILKAAAAQASRA